MNGLIFSSYPDALSNLREQGGLWKHCLESYANWLSDYTGTVVNLRVLRVRTPCSPRNYLIAEMVNSL